MINEKPNKYYWQLSNNFMVSSVVCTIFKTLLMILVPLLHSELFNCGTVFISESQVQVEYP
jgi:hypothetical protein